jgi:hypothetical protein
MSSNFNKIREKFQELGDNDTNKGDYRNGYLQALNDAIDIVKLFAIPDVSKQRELLIAYTEYLAQQDITTSTYWLEVYNVDAFLKSNL